VLQVAAFIAKDVKGARHALTVTVETQRTADTLTRSPLRNALNERSKHTEQRNNLPFHLLTREPDRSRHAFAISIAQQYRGRNAVRTRMKHKESVDFSG
jgi:hypothetical protein